MNYSGIPGVRPPLKHQESGPSRGVVSRQEYKYKFRFTL